MDADGGHLQQLTHFNRPVILNPKIAGRWPRQRGLLAKARSYMLSSWARISSVAVG
jgi:hypothetical protein